MMKNLKKVISAVAALALSASTFVAFAQDFPDVANTANYAKAVDQLSSLGVVTGYDDGTFGPDRLVTRAEMATFIVRALGEDAQAKSAANQNTQFSDVTSNHWAAGYVTVGVNSSPMFIQGMGDGTFAPDANVTFAQATTMLVRAVGYEDYAKNSTWPTGYLSYGSQLNITTGVAGSVANDQELNRGQVAILLANTLTDAPLLKEGNMSYDIWGKPTFDHVKMDGEGKDWETLLINKHDAYKVQGTVVSTRKQNDSLDADEVEFEIQRANRWVETGFEYITATTTPRKIKVNVGNTKAADNLNVFADAIIAVDNDDNYTLISFSASGKSDSVKFEATDYADDHRTYGTDKTAFTENVFYVYTDENQSRTTSYKLADSKNNRGAAQWYVNGVEIVGFNEADFEKYVENNEVGEVTLIDSKGANNVATPDGYYDSVMITYYADAVVKSVSNASSTKPRIFFEDWDKTGLGNSASYLSLDLEDEDKTYTFKLGNPTESTDIAVTDLAQNDVLSISWDVKETLNNSDFVTVYVSRDTVEGKVTTKHADKGAMIDSAYNELNDNMGKISITIGEEYTLYKDAFGKVAYAEEGTSSKLYGVLDNVYQLAAGTYQASIITNEGRRETYDLSNQKGDNFNKIAAYLSNEESDDNKAKDEKGAVITKTIAGQTVKLDAPQYRVVNYSVNNRNEVTIKSEVDPAASNTTNTYRASSNRIGSIALNDNSIVLDVSEYVNDDEFGVMGSLVDETVYEAYAYNRIDRDNSFSFVLILNGLGGYNTDTPLTIFVTSQIMTDEDEGEELVNVDVLSEGESKTLKISSDYETAFNELGLATGDAFIYRENSRGYVTDVKKVLDINDNYDTFNDNVFTAAFGAHTFNEVVGAYAKDGTNEGELKKGNNDDGYFAFGPVLDARNSITLATLNDQNLSLEYSGEDYGFDRDARVYYYDYTLGGSKNAEARVGYSESSSIFTETNINDYSYEDAAKTLINWTKPSDDGADAMTAKDSGINYALVKVVNNYVTEGYAIIPPLD